MRTELYKMWTKFCSSKKYRAMADITWYDEKLNIAYSSYDVAMGKAKNATLYGTIYFNFRQHLMIKYPSKEYNAWNAFMTCRDDGDSILEFVYKFIDKFKDSLPETQIFLDIHLMKIKDILENESLRHSMIIALNNDILNRKNIIKHI